MLAAVRHWLQPPVFPNDPLKTRHADFLNIALLSTLGFAPVLIVGNLLGGRTPSSTIVLDLAVIMTTLIARTSLRRGHVSSVSLVTLLSGLIIVTLASFGLGTIRTPTTMLYLVLIIMAGVLFDLTGTLIMTALSSLGVFVLTVCEMAGWLPRPDYTVTITQWVTYSVLFSCISLFSYFAVRRTQQALLKADQELAERQRTERALRLRDEQLREAQHLAHLGSWDYDLAAQTLSWSDELYRIFGLQPGELSPTMALFESFCHPAERDAMLRCRDQRPAQPQTTMLEHRIIRRDGEERWVQEHVRHVVDGAGQLARITGTLQDITDRKQLEEALRTSEARYRSLFEDSPISLWEEDFSQVKRYLDELRHSGITDLRAYFEQQPAAVNHCAALVQVLNVNQATLTLLEMPDKATVLAALNHTLAEEAHLPFREELCVLASGATHCVLDEVQRTATGRELFITVNISIAPGFADTWGKVLVSVLDITERRQSELALRDSQQMIEGIINTVPVRVFWKDTHSIYLGCNAAFARDAGGLSPADIIGKDDYQLGWRAQADLYRADDREVIDNGRAKLNIEEPQTTPSGQISTLLTNKVPLRNAQGEISGVLGTYMDITERKRAEKAERDQRQLAEALRDTAAALNSTLSLTEVLDRILNNIECVAPHDGANIMLINDDGLAHIVRQRNSGAFDLTAPFRVEDVPNMRHMRHTSLPLAISDVHHDPDWLATPDTPWIASHVGAPLCIRGRVIGFLNLDSATPGFYTAEHAERLQAFADQAAVAVENARLYEEVQHHSQALEERVRDRTTELLAANKRLTELDRLKDEFISRISHELRTPLTSIKIYLELLETAQPEKREKYQQTLMREADRLHVLIEDILTITQLSRDELDIELDHADLNLLIESRLTTWQAAATRRALTFQAQLATGLPPARLDKLYTLQIVTQLINNAVSYTPSGSITLTTARVVEAECSWITVSVTDTGPGIVEADLPHIFERFYRGRAAADYKTPGTGVGLAISRQIAQKMGGRLSVETRPGVGSTFRLWLPAA